MNKATKGIVAGVAGIGLLSGGATFALWSDSEIMAGGEINSGDLDISMTSDGVWEDISPDVAGNPSVITDLSSFQIVPGDTIQLTQEFRIDLEGENLEANVYVDAPGLTDVEGELKQYLDTTYTIIYEDGFTRSGEVVGGTFQGVNGVRTLPSSEDNYTVQIQVHFDEDTPEQLGVNSTVRLEDVTFTLAQSPRS